MQDNTPASKLQKIGLALREYVAPFLPMLEAQGGQVDFKELLSLVGRLGNIPELQDIVKFQIPDEGIPVQAAGSSQPRMATNTTRTNVRVNRPGATRSGKDNVLSQILLGGNPQPAEAATMGRQVS